jgi:hypothetical protein
MKTARQLEASRERMRKLWADPEYRAMRSKVSSETMKRLRADPSFEANRQARHAEAKRTPEARSRARRPASEQKKAKLSAFRKQLMQDPERRAQQREYLWRGVESRMAFFTCPEHLRPTYKKLRKHLGVEAAREEIRRLIAEEFAAKANYREAA